jgi:Beta-propeller repeat
MASNGTSAVWRLRAVAVGLRDPRIDSGELGRMQRGLLIAAVVGVAAVLVFAGLRAVSIGSGVNRAAAGEAGDPREGVGAALAPRFEPNVGQANEQVRFLSRGPGYTMLMTGNGAALKLGTLPQRERGPGAKPARLAEQAVIGLTFEGANPDPVVTGNGRLAGVSNYLRGSDPDGWLTGVPNYSGVTYHELYDGVDLDWYANRAGELEFDLTLAPGVDPAGIRLSYTGAERLVVDRSGALVLHVGGSQLRQAPPVVYQHVDGVRREVRGRYLVHGDHRVGFRLGSYDTTRPLVIDPVLSYSTYLGGSGDEQGNVIVVDRDRNVYLTGNTTSIDFPTTPGAFDATHNGTLDAFVTKLDRTGSKLLYSTYLGGSGGDFDSGETIAVDRASNAYVTGVTQSSDFPTTPGALDTSLGGTEDGYVAKLNRDGSKLLYSTYLGGSDEDGGFGITVDDDSHAYVTGFSRSSDFPTVRAFDSTLDGEDAIVAKLNRNGSALSYSTYLGGSGDEEAGSIALDDDDNAHVTGFTGSSDFPTTARAFDSTLGGTDDVFVTKLNRNGSALRYSTYLGGSGSESLSFGIAVDDDSHAYVTSRTFSSDFPTTARAFDSTLGGTDDAFVTKLDRNGSALRYSTYLGGSGEERSFSITVDDDSHAYVIGRTLSGDFPTAEALDSGLGGAQDAFVTKLNAKGSALPFSTYLGGGGIDQGVGIAVDSSPNAYVTGFAASSDFPTTPRAVDRTLAGPQDAFVAKITRLDNREHDD